MSVQTLDVSDPINNYSLFANFRERERERERETETEKEREREKEMEGGREERERNRFKVDFNHIFLNY